MASGAERAVGDGAAERADAIERAVPPGLRRHADERLRERARSRSRRGRSPSARAGAWPKGWSAIVLQRALLARRLAADALRQPEGEHADDDVDEAAGDVAGAGEALEDGGLDEASRHVGATVVFMPAGSPRRSATSTP